VTIEIVSKAPFDCTITEIDNFARMVRGVAKCTMSASKDASKALRD